MFLVPVDASLIPKTQLDMYLENDIIVLGKIISTGTVNGNFDTSPKTEYQIKVLQYIKGEKSLNVLTAIGLGSNNATRHIDNETIFFEGQRVFLFLNQRHDDSLIISPYSIFSETLDPDSQFILPPLKLYKAGIPTSEINCKSNLKLVLKSTNDSPLCLKPKSVELLLERGWINIF